MAKFYETITDDIREFINKQHMFFVATAPLSAEGHINLSPKGLDVFRVLSPNRVAYLDMTGSGNETSAHLLENKRITFMLCSFEGAPNILRLYGTGYTVLPDTPEWDALIGSFTLYTGVRQIIVADITLAQTSCGYAVPLYEYEGDRDTLTRYWENRGDEWKMNYQHEKNACSLDKLPSAIGAVQGIENANS
jgi:hypothetical protein